MMGLYDDGGYNDAAYKLTLQGTPMRNGWR